MPVDVDIRPDEGTRVVLSEPRPGMPLLVCFDGTTEVSVVAHPSRAGFRHAGRLARELARAAEQYARRCDELARPRTIPVFHEPAPPHTHTRH